uniref:Ig-like domain-containing protein n=1 Tax=Oreochromis niloticus TaxID=8128 RepID=A0A669DPH9_ORENI
MTEAAMSLSAAASGFVLFLLSLSGVQSQDNNGVSYTSPQICAFKGSTVDIGCSFKYPLKLLKKVWLTEGIEYNPDDLKKDSGRVSYSSQWYSCTLTIRDLRESDSAVYKFRYTTNRGDFTVLPGVTLTVTALQVHVKKSSHSNWATLTCQSSCQLHDRPSYIWYKNGQIISTGNHYWYSHYLKLTDSYSCAFRDHEASPSPSVCYQGDSCNRVNYSNRRICAFKGSSVDISSTYNSYESQIQSQFWFRSGRGSEDLREDSQYAGRVELIETERGRSTLRIRDLTESDSAQYHFKFKTQSFEWKSSLPGTTLTVTALQVKVSRIISVHESQTEAELKCESSCTPAGHLLFVWFKNNQFMVEQSSYQDLFSPGDVISCAFKGHEDYRSDPVCKFTSLCY